MRRHGLVRLGLVSSLSLLVSTTWAQGAAPEKPAPAAPTAPAPAAPTAPAADTAASNAKDALPAAAAAPKVTADKVAADNKPAEGEATEESEEAEGDALPLVRPDLSKPTEVLNRLPHHKHRLYYKNLAAARLNPLGLTNQFELGYRRQLSYRNEPIFEKSYVGAALDTQITPAFGYVGGKVEFQPVLLVNFWGSYGLMGNFGSFSYTRSFPDASATYDDKTLSDTRDQDYASLGQRATLSGTFQYGIAGLAMRNNTKATYFNMKLNNDDKVWWDAMTDMLVPNKGWLVTHDTDVVLQADNGFTFGMRYTLTHALYRQEHLGGNPNLNSATHRLGPALLYKFFEEDEGAKYNKPTLIVLAQWWMQHRYRTVQKPALPYLVIAFRHEGDLWLSDKSRD